MDTPLLIYLVEDDLFLAATMAALLEGEGRHVKVFETAEACLPALRDQAPDILLLDVELPGMDGYALCEEIRGDVMIPDMQIIFVSAHESLESRLRGFDAGGNDYLVKPVEPDMLDRKIQRARKDIEARRELAAQADFATRTAMTAMSSSGELGVILDFMRKSFGCRSVAELQDALLHALRSYDLRGVVELRGVACGVSVLTTEGNASELEASILRAGMDKGRIIEFKNRCILNHGGCSMLVHNMPATADPDRHGRLRDHLHMLTEAADARLSALDVELREVERAKVLSEAARYVRASLANILADEFDAQQQAVGIMTQALADLSKILLTLGLHEADESYLLEYVEQMGNNVRAAYAERSTAGPALQQVVSQLEALASR